MKQLTQLFLLILLFSCNQSNKAPDVSGITIALVEKRFEKDFFLIDTLQLKPSLGKLSQQYPGFTSDFLYNILGTTPETAPIDIPSFIKSYQPIYANTQTAFTDIKPMMAIIKKGFQYVHYYFPDYKLPSKIITFIGPINSFGSIITTDAIAIGLQLFLGKNHPLYASEQGMMLYPAFISRRFEPDYIPVNALRNIVDDLYPETALGKPLVEQMIESGKRLYLLDHFLPQVSDTLKTGYTAVQLKACEENEKNIWSFFIQNDLLYKTDPQFTRDYMNDGPSTQAFGEGSPGNIGQFVGWQIVKKWMNKNPQKTLQQLMDMNPGKLFAEVKYKPV